MAHALRRASAHRFGLMLVQFGLQATALRFGQLSVVQPLLTTELLFLLIILGVWFRYRLTVQEWSALSPSWSGSVGSSSWPPQGGNAIPTNHQWLVASVLLIRRSPDASLPPFAARVGGVPQCSVPPLRSPPPTVPR